MSSDRIRMSGLVSGLDTETIVGALVSAASYKTTKLKNTQTKLGWKQETWKSLNSEVYSLYSGKLDNMRYQGNYNAKKATIDNDIATVTADNNAILGSQTLEVHQMAKSGYLTGGKVTMGNTDTLAGSSALLGDVFGISNFSADEVANGFKINVTVGGQAKEVALDVNMTMDKVAEAFSKAGVSANYDATTGRFFLASKTSGENANFEIEYGEVGESKTTAQKVLDKLGLAYKYTDTDGKREYDYSVSGGNTPVKIQGQNAKIVLNGAEFESASNTFNINGLNITAKGVSEKDPSEPGKFKASTVTTSVDVDAVYDSIKDFFKSYNELINKLDTYYNADAAKGYDVLSEKEKEAMSDDEVEQWEKKIKDSLLRKDDNLNTLISLFKDNLSKSYVIGGKSYSLSSFGIETLGYWEAKDNEHGMYHIAGDPDDDSTKSKDDVLKKMISSNPEAAGEFFSTLFKGVYNELNKSMRFVEGTRSAMKIYDDKLLQTEYDKLGKDIESQEKKVTDLEDFYYDKFTAMEKALTKLNAQSSSFSSMIG
ncbi:MAG: flagellar filament capping protein FliD [Lachnospiraceae bacterium]|nr:flagellar filament capping protein FliD [Lachnospiraceae bacterium]